MQRRKLLAAMGSLAAGGAATIGTGAFTSVSANRDVSVSVADDSQAYLRIRKARESNNSGGNRITPNADEYVTVNNGQVGLDFTKTDEGADGINKNATTIIDNLLQIQNQGTQEVIVAYEGLTSNGNDLTNQGLALYHEDPDQSELGDPTNDGLLNLQRGDTANDLNNLPRLEPGETLNNVGAFFFDDVNVSAINGSSITFLAGDEPEDL
jgi:hypothetical protein